MFFYSLRSEHTEKHNNLKGRYPMKTAEQIISFLEAELSEAIELHDASTDAAQRFAMMLKAYTISELLDEIKEG